MQVLRLSNFTSRPTLKSIQALVMLVSFLTNSGRFVDAWSLCGLTIHLAHSVGLHSNLQFLDLALTSRESLVRRNLWWWLLYTDQEYFMTLGRPLNIPGTRDCPPPDSLTTDPLASDRHHHSFLDPSLAPEPSPQLPSHQPPPSPVVLRSRQIVIEFCLALIDAFILFYERVPSLLVHWTIGQQSFNACKIFLLDAIDTGGLENIERLELANLIFIEIDKSRMHRLTGLAMIRIAEGLTQLQRTREARKKCEAEISRVVRICLSLDNASRRARLINSCNSSRRSRESVPRTLYFRLIAIIGVASGFADQVYSESLDARTAQNRTRQVSRIL